MGSPANPLMLDWSPLPGNRAHLVLSSACGMPLACGAIAVEWLLRATDTGRAMSPLMAIRWCDHAGTHRAPRSVWTGEPSIR